MKNVRKLHWELEKAGIPIEGCYDGGIWFKKEATQEQKDLAQNIFNNHSENWYIENRIREYPSIGDQLDYIYKTLKVLKSNGIILGVDGDEWLNKIDAIKAKYPKE